MRRLLFGASTMPAGSELAAGVCRDGKSADFASAIHRFRARLSRAFDSMLHRVAWIAASTDWDDRDRNDSSQ
jgi:hypothetical protein